MTCSKPSIYGTSLTPSTTTPIAQVFGNDLGVATATCASLGGAYFTAWVTLFLVTDAGLVATAESEPVSGNSGIAPVAVTLTYGPYTEAGAPLSRKHELIAWVMYKMNTGGSPEIATADGYEYAV